MLSLLTSIKENEDILFYEEHRLRHPLGICTVSESRFYRALQSLMDFLGDAEDIKRYRKDDSLFLKTKEAISSLTAYIDDMYLVFKCYYPANRVDKKITFADRWLEKAGCNEIANFKSSIKEFTEPFIIADDCIKHNHARIAQLRFNTLIYGSAYGFYVLDMSDTGALTPNEEIHPEFKGMATAFSYNRFLLQLISSFYFVSSHAERTLRKILTQEFDFSPPSGKTDIDSSSIIDLIKQLNGTLTKILFDDEYEKCAQVEYENDTLIIKIPADKVYIKSRFEKYTRAKIEMVDSADGVTRSWKLPYMR